MDNKSLIPIIIMESNYITGIKQNSFGITISLSVMDEYHIPVDSFLDRRDTIYSDWIMQLLEKMWIDRESLYRIGAILNKADVHLKIDWLSTFTVVEKALYVNDSPYLANFFKVNQSSTAPFFEYVRYSQSMPSVYFKPTVLATFSDYGFRY